MSARPTGRADERDVQLVSGTVRAEKRAAGKEEEAGARHGGGLQKRATIEIILFDAHGDWSMW